MHDDESSELPHHHLIGGGIASLSAAVFLIRDAGMSGKDITIYEQSDRFGGSLDGGGSPENGYSTRGGRMFEPNFVCTFDLLASIPSLDAPDRTVKDDIDAFNLEVVGSSRCRLVRKGEKADASSFGFAARDLLDLTWLLMRPEGFLANATIEDCFNVGFFQTNFWITWSTTFAFLPWHSAIEFRRYLLRFIHLVPGFKKLEGVLRTRYNQYDSLIAPVKAWLEVEEVRFQMNCQITDLDVVRTNGSRQVTAFHVSQNGNQRTVPVTDRDWFFITLGSMTECSSLGSPTMPPAQRPANESGSFNLWRKLADRDPAFGQPKTFCGDINKTKWMSFTATLHRPDFFEFMQSFTGNVTGTGGLVTFADSNWLMSIVLFHQPHFRGQPNDVYLFWGNGLFPDRPGNYVNKPMTECTGDEILKELSGHLRLEDQSDRLFEGAINIPCMMPLITSQFMPRSAHDRPPVIANRTSNFALMGQYCEIPGDVVFTVEYSVRSAMTAVYSLLNVEKKVPALRRPHRNPLMQIQALKTLLLN